jgi:hypothetical protein
MFIPAYFIGSTARPCGGTRQGATENCLGLASQARPRPETPMRILLLNGNTDPAITDLIAKRAQEALPRLGLPACDLVPATAPFGARYIATRGALMPPSSPVSVNLPLKPRASFCPSPSMAWRKLPSRLPWNRRHASHC